MTFEATNSLFRPEALRHREERLAGGPLAISGAWQVGAIAICFVCLIAIATGLTRATYAPRQTVAGYLAPEQGFVKVYAARPGIVQELLVHDGDAVAIGQIIAHISVEQGLANSVGASAPTQILDELSARERTLSESVLREEDLTHAQSGRLEAKARELRKQLAELDSEIKVLEKRIAAAEDLQRATERLRAQGFATPNEVTYRKDQVLTLQKEWYALTRSETSLATDLSDAELQQRQLPDQLKQRQVVVKNQLSELRQQKAALEVERTYTITAPIAGKVTVLQAEVGALTTPVQPMMALVPEHNTLEARLLVPSRAIGFVHAGEPVRMRYAAYPYEQYGMHDGVVKEVSRVSLRPEESPSALASTEATYRVTVKLTEQAVAVAGRSQPLQTGMLLEADLLEEPRALWAWIFRPILAVRGKL
jgi:membrane fusion protein